MDPASKFGVRLGWVAMLAGLSKAAFGLYVVWVCCFGGFWSGKMGVSSRIRVFLLKGLRVVL